MRASGGSARELECSDVYQPQRRGLRRHERPRRVRPRRLRERRFAPKDTIFTPGDPDDQLYFLLSGAVRLYKEAATAVLKDSGVFGKLNLVEGRWHDVFAEAVTEARVASIHKASLERVIKSNPAFALRLTSSDWRSRSESEEKIESLLHREVSNRLATLLLNLGERFGEDDQADTLIDVRLTREAVSKVMSEFQREGVIETRNRRVAILDRGALFKRASGPSGLSVDGQLPI